jgi:signal transduction histidine kinase
MRGEPRSAVIVTTVVATVLSAVGTLLGPESPVAAIGAVLVVVAPVLAGRLVRHQQLQNAELAALTEELRLERVRAEEAAVGAERARIAQELHDVVGHEVTLIAIQAEAAGAALRLAPDRAAEPIETIRTTAHRVLAEMRGVVDVLSPGDDGPPAENLRGLVARSKAAGLEVTFEETGTPAEPHAPESLAAYRIVRECLTNAARHAPAQPLSLEVSWGPHEVVVTATNPGAASGDVSPGRGLTGVRHRAELLGGTYAATADDGQFAVRVALPTGVREPR